MTYFWSAPRFIAVAAPSKKTDDEHKKRNPDYEPKPPVYEDYALMKVLYMLRTRGFNSNYPVNVFQYGNTVIPIDFSGLQDSDVIFVVGHGNDHGLYAMGPKAEEGNKRFIRILTEDGNLKAKRKGKEIVIMLLSCRAGLGLHKAVARKLTTALGQDVTVGGPLGFTFGSHMTNATERSEVLIQGLPWCMEYPQAYDDPKDPTQAEKETSAREGRTITYESKKKEIEEFIKQKKRLEVGFKQIIGKLKSKEVNKALDELEKNFGVPWKGLVHLQFDLYFPARKESDLEFDMWYPKVLEGYVWTTGKKTTAAEAVLKGDVTLLGARATSIQ